MPIFANKKPKEELKEKPKENRKKKENKRILRTTVTENSSMADAKSFIDKMRLALLHREIVSGEKDRKILEEERRYNIKQQALYATCKKFLLTSLEWFETQKIDNKKYLKIQIDPKFDSVLYDILNSIQFENYIWIEEDRNEDLLALGASIPHIILFSVRYMEE